MFGRWSPSSVSLNVPLEAPESLWNAAMFWPWQIIIHPLVFCTETSPWILITICDLCISLLAASDIVQSSSHLKQLEDRCLGWIKRLDLIFPFETKRGWEKRQELTLLAAQLHPTSPRLNKTSATYWSTQSLLSGIIDYFETRSRRKVSWPFS